MSADVYLFFSKDEKLLSAGARARVAEICTERGWNFQSRMLPRVRTPEGRPLHMVQSDLAAGLYPRAHRVPLLTLVFGTDPVVPLIPDMKEALFRRKHMPLQQYLEYKSCWVRMQPELNNHAWAGVFASWIERVECEGEHDPRLFPFHVFAGRGANLDVEEERAVFNQRYGAGAIRHDDAGKRWALIPRWFHGQERLKIAGLELSAGFHWDVVHGESWRLEAPRGIWRVDGHINIYPDVALRWKEGKVRKLA